ncbi:hypothetical protein [Desulfovulcanus sp.]
MRRQKVITFGEDQISVKEMTVEEVGELLPIFEDILESDKDLSEKEILDLLQKHFNTLKTVLKKCVKPDPSQIGMSAMLEVFKGFYEVNRDFFVQITSALTKGEASSEKN